MYSQEITRRHRTAFVIAIDQSGSMQEKVYFGRHEMSKAAAVARITNSLLTELVDRSRRTDGVRNYYDVAVVGYSGDEARMLLDEEGFIAIDRLARRQPPCETLYSEETLPDGTVLLAGHSVRQWLLPKAAGKTPMYEALLRVRDLLGEWCANDSNRDSFPPVVINITDGEASDCTDDELRRVCAQIRRLGTDDGNVLLFNIHVSTDSTSPAMVFPMPDELARANPYARLLAECSSIMPEAFDEAVRDFKGAGAVPPFYGMGYNTSIIELLSIINIGSRSITNIE